MWKYYYDSDGKRRIKSKTVAGVSSITDNCSYYFYEGEDLICQQDIGDLVQDDSQYEPKFLLLDHLGSTRAELVFTESGGTFSPVIQEYYDLMPYGEVIDPPTTQESVLFTGKQRDTESDLDFFGARYYTLNTLRWSSPDSLFEDNWVDQPQSWNLYLYCSSNPINRTDPNGAISLQDTAEAVDGFLRGAGASLTHGMIPALTPQSTDSDLNRTAQLAGSMFVLAISSESIKAGGITMVAGAAASETGFGAAGIPIGAGTAALGVLGVSGSTTNIYRICNPYGASGKPDHQEKVDELEQKAREESKLGETVLRERKIQGQDSNRKPDVQIVNTEGRTRKVFEAERYPNRQKNIQREKEYNNLKVEQETHPLKK